MRHRLLARLALVGIAAAAAPSFPKAADASVSYKRDIQPIFDEACVACHQKGSAEAKLVLQRDAAYAATVGVASQEAPGAPLVDPGKPDRSYLLAKVVGDHAKLGGKGARMPLGDPLTDQNIARIRAWIAAGAARN